jgi:hypothetical protein
MNQHQRIHFLDFSRSVAILMMLQGHFISMTLESYPTFMAEEGKEYADRRRKAYKMRHEKDRHVRGSAGYYADQLLW